MKKPYVRMYINAIEYNNIAYKVQNVFLHIVYTCISKTRSISSFTCFYMLPKYSILKKEVPQNLPPLRRKKTKQEQKPQTGAPANCLRRKAV